MRFVCLIGPTGSGKTELLRRLFLPPARVGAAEIISADSMQVYRGMDIGTAKPSRDDRALLPHHLVDICTPDQQFHVGDFVESCERLIPQITSRGRIPVVSGGTAFYFRNLLFGLPGTPRGELDLRKKLRERMERDGVEPLYRELEQVDPVTASRISPADRYRIVRALEVFGSSGRPLSEFPPPDAIRPDIETLIIGIRRDRRDLRDRLIRRTRQMFDAGLGAEVDSLLGAGYSRSDPGLRGIGYREILDMRNAAVEGSSSCARSPTTEDLIELIAVHTAQYAKRQMNFFRRIPNVHWFDLTRRDSQDPDAPSNFDTADSIESATVSIQKLLTLFWGAPR